VSAEACEAGDPGGCLAAGGLVGRGPESVDGDEDSEEAEKAAWAGRACRLGHTVACGIVAPQAAMSDDDGQLPVPPPGALALCRSGHDDVCADLAAGWGGQDEVAPALAALDEHCRGGWPPSCAAAGVAHEKAGREASAAAAFRRGCELGMPEACAGTSRREDRGTATAP